NNSEDMPHDFVIVLDSTGIKLTNRGEWLSKRYGKRRKSSWVLHMKNSIEKAEGSIVKEVIADTGYDTHEIFKHLADRGIKPVVEVREKQ
ncbi:MAG: IS5/IS1182 family transposase, partial [Candidatus Calescibacterium sp.]|nr:IS5/IS1182 family transposase [Candidatus Calescibacterium sp.]